LALNNTNYARDAVYINGLLLELRDGLLGHYFTLRASGRDVVSQDESGKYGPKTITIEYAIDGDTVADFKENLDYLQHLLNRKDADISFNDEFGLFMIGDIHNLGLKEKHATWGLGSYEIKCENPFKYSKTVGEVTATKTTDGEQTFTIDYQGTVPTEPIIEVTPGAENTAYHFSQDAYLEFINVLNNKNNKNISIGSSFPDGTATKVSNPDFKRTSLVTLTQDGWLFTPNNGAASGSFNDPRYNKGSGLTYYAVYPTNYDTSGTYEDPKDTKNMVYKTLSDSITNWLCNYSVRMWADDLLAGGSLKLSAQTTDSKETGVVIYKNSLDNLKGTVLYYVDDKVMGSDVIDLQKYSSSLGLTDRQYAITSRSNKIYFQDDVVNKKRPQSAIIEQKVIGGTYIYGASNNNISFSKLGQTYTFKVADLPTRRFVYARESGSDSYNRFNIGFKPNMISSSLNNLTIQICGIDIMSLTKDTLINNWRILSPGNTYKLNSANIDLERTMQNTAGSLYIPELAGIHNVEHSLLIEPEASTSFKCIYYNKDSGNDPEVKVRYNTIYI